MFTTTNTIDTILRSLVNDINIATKTKKIGHNYYAVFNVNTQNDLINKATQALEDLDNVPDHGNAPHPNW